MRAQAHKIIPTPSFSSTNMLTHTYSLRFALHHFYSLNSVSRMGHSSWAPAGVFLVSAKPHAQNLLAKMIEYSMRKFKKMRLDRSRRYFLIFGAEALGEGLEFGWTGILGMVSNIG